MHTTLRKVLATVFWLPARALMFLIQLYQLTLSPDHGLLRHFFPYGFCRHTPTCSHDALHQLRTELLLVALFRIIKRVLSCNPWTRVSDEKLREVVGKIG